MLSPEDFRRQLDQTDKGLVEKHQADQRKKTICEARQRQDTKEAQERVKQQRSEAEEEVRQKNQEVIELDSRLPIGQYLEILKNKIAPKERVEKWGPEDGVIAYVFSYGFRMKKVIDSPGGFSQLMSAGDRTGGASFWRHHYPEEFHLELQKRVFGITLNGLSGRINIYHEAIGHKIPDKMITPFVLNPFSRRSCGWDQKTPMVKIDLISQGAPQQLVQSLTNFYVGLKTGQGK